MHIENALIVPRRRAANFHNSRRILRTRSKHSKPTPLSGEGGGENHVRDSKTKTSRAIALYLEVSAFLERQEDLLARPVPFLKAKWLTTPFVLAKVKIGVNFSEKNPLMSFISVFRQSFRQRWKWRNEFSELPDLFRIYESMRFVPVNILNFVNFLQIYYWNYMIFIDFDEKSFRNAEKTNSINTNVYYAIYSNVGDKIGDFAFALLHFTNVNQSALWWEKSLAFRPSVTFSLWYFKCVPFDGAKYEMKRWFCSPSDDRHRDLLTLDVYYSHSGTCFN